MSIEEMKKEINNISDALWRSRTEAVRTSASHSQIGHAIDALGRLKTIVEKAEKQEPVAWTEQQFYDDGIPNPCALLKWAGRKAEDDFPIGTKFYTSPPQRQPLTDEQIDVEHDKLFPRPVYDRENVRIFARAIESAHGIKKGGAA